jgi:hypothetical protein
VLVAVSENDANAAPIKPTHKTIDIIPNKIFFIFYSSIPGGGRNGASRPVPALITRDEIKLLQLGDLDKAEVYVKRADIALDYVSDSTIY